MQATQGVILIMLGVLALYLSRHALGATSITPSLPNPPGTKIGPSGPTGPIFQVPPGSTFTPTPGGLGSKISPGTHPYVPKDPGFLPDDTSGPKGRPIEIVPGDLVPQASQALTTLFVPDQGSSTIHDPDNPYWSGYVPQEGELTI